MPSYLHDLRMQVGHEKIPLIFASACIRNGTGHLLWQRRADFGWWGLPGGILEPDESLSGCISREVLEETGLEVAPGRLIGVYCSPDYDVTYPNGDQVHQMTFCFDCHVVGGGLKADRSETIALEWLSIHDRPSPALWYNAMLEDLIVGRKEASFTRGGPGRRLTDKPFFEYIHKRLENTPFILPRAMAFLQDKDGCLLLLCQPGQGVWELPWVWMEMGERIDRTLEDAILRETGMKVKAIGLTGVYSGIHPGLRNPCEGIWREVTLLFRCSACDGKAEMQGLNAGRGGFFPIEDLPSLPECHLRFIYDGLVRREEAFF